MADKFIIPEFMQNQSSTDIITRMLNILPNTISKEENGWVCDLFTPVAIEHARAIEFVLTEAIKNIIPKYSYGDILLNHAENRGLIRRSATYAKVVLTVRGISGTVIPAGFQFSTAATLENAGIVFAVEKEYQIPESGEIAVFAVCINAGIIGNVAAETILLMVKPQKGITSIVNKEAAYGGFEEETEDSLRQRIAEYDAKQGSSFVGSPADYKRWAMEVEGVGEAKIVPATDDSGIVTIILTDLNGQPASDEICRNVYCYIMRPDSLYERLAPCNALLKVIPANALKISIETVVELENGYTLEMIETAFTADILEYFKSGRVREEIKYTEIGSILIQTEGVFDYTNLKINGDTVNISINTGDVAVLENVVLLE